MIISRNAQGDVDSRQLAEFNSTAAMGLAMDETEIPENQSTDYSGDMAGSCFSPTGSAVTSGYATSIPPGEEITFGMDVCVWLGGGGGACGCVCMRKIALLYEHMLTHVGPRRQVICSTSMLRHSDIQVSSTDNLTPCLICAPCRDTATRVPPG